MGSLIHLGPVELEGQRAHFQAKRLRLGGHLFGRALSVVQPHLQLGLSDEELRSEIRVTVLHEMAHHLGIDDERLHELGWD